MNVVLFDTLKLADKLQAGGFTPEQAQTASFALADVFENEVGLNRISQNSRFPPKLL
jgi:hypothetical protein